MENEKWEQPEEVEEVEEVVLDVKDKKRVVDWPLSGDLLFGLC